MMILITFSLSVECMCKESQEAAPHGTANFSPRADMTEYIFFLPVALRSLFSQEQPLLVILQTVHSYFAQSSTTSFNFL